MRYVRPGLKTACVGYVGEILPGKRRRDLLEEYAKAYKQLFVTQAVIVIRLL